MSRTPAIEMRRLENQAHPPYPEVVAKATEFMARRALSLGNFADMLSLGHSTLAIYMTSRYDTHAGAARSTEYMDARIWEYLERNWPRDPEPPSEDLLETKGYRQILACIEDGIETGASSLIYGPPSSEKSFVAEQITARYREHAVAKAEHAPLLYVIADSTRFSATDLVRAISRQAQVWVRGNGKRPYIEALVEEFNVREFPPAIIVDEAQNLSEDAVECLRIALHERTKGKRLRDGSTHKGAGMILMGSHTLFSSWMARRHRTEQFFSRNSYRIQLTGMTREEALEIGARALGRDHKKAKLSDEQTEDLLKNCLVLDHYATDADGRPLRDEKGKPVLRTYYSSRRLLEYIRQKRRFSVNKVLAESVA